MHHSRSEFLTGASALLFAAPAAPTLEATADPPGVCPVVGPVEAMARLVSGNDRFVNGRLKHAGQSPRRRTQVAPHQCPFATVLDCADSRVPPKFFSTKGWAICSHAASPETSRTRPSRARSNTRRPTSTRP